MMMDISSPAELLRVEQARFGDGRRQAYLTFMNEHEDVITGLSGLAVLLDEMGKTIERRKVVFSGLTAKPREAFVCHLALDNYPEFDRMEMAVETASFVYGKAWQTNPSRIMDCEPPVLPSGPERVALVAVAGYDAVCFPERHETHWICVCGRFNRIRWLTCHRCGRNREDTLAFLTPEQVVEGYGAKVDEERVRDQERLIKKARKQEIEKKKAEAERARRAENRQKALRAIGITACVILVFSLVIWGGSRLLAQTGTQAGEIAFAGAKGTFPPVDYLDPIRK